MSAIFDIELQDAGPHRDESEDDDVIEIDVVIESPVECVFPPRTRRESRDHHVAFARDNGTCSVVLTPHLFSFSQDECVALNVNDIVK